MKRVYTSASEPRLLRPARFTRLPPPRRSVLSLLFAFVSSPTRTSRCRWSGSGQPWTTIYTGYGRNGEGRTLRAERAEEDDEKIGEKSKNRHLSVGMNEEANRTRPHREPLPIRRFVGKVTGTSARECPSRWILLSGLKLVRNIFLLSARERFEFFFITNANWHL